jgi:hypothetical protein
MNSLPLWANGPFELLVHAEGHIRRGDDFDRRIALISFDNAIEVAIATYLTLHPIHRGNRAYRNADVERWLANFHSKLDFLETELRSRGLSWSVDRGHIVYAHDQRNHQYHGGQKGIPEKQLLTVVRTAALWVFSVLYDVPDAEQRLDYSIAALAAPSPPQRDKSYDRAIDRVLDLVEVGGQLFYASEVLFFVDYAAYCETGLRLCNGASWPNTSEGA